MAFQQATTFQERPADGVDAKGKAHVTSRAQLSPDHPCAILAGGLEGGVIAVELFYPRQPGHPRTVEVGLTDVRAADSIQIRYDFDRDGWAILQASTFAWDVNDSTCDPDWQEVAFVQAWARQKSVDGEPV